MEVNVVKHTGENGGPEAWKVTDSPENYTELLKEAIIRVEINVERMEGKFKMSQEELETVLASLRALERKGPDRRQIL